MSDELPFGWTYTNLFNVSEMFRGVTYSKNDASNTSKEEYTPIVRANNLQNNKFILDDLVYIPTHIIKNEQFIQKYDIIIATSSGSINVLGKSVQSSYGMNFSFGAFCGLIRPSSNIDPKYLGMYFMSPGYKKIILEKGRGVNINNLKRNDFESLQVPIPPLEEQKRIAHRLEVILDGLQRVRIKLSTLKNNTKKIKEAILNQIFEQIQNRVTLETIINKSQYGWTTKSSHLGSYRYLRTTDITQPTLNWNNVPFCEDLPEDIEKYLLQEDDILISRAGSIGFSYLVHKIPYPSLFASYLIRLKINKKIALPDYVFLFFQSPSYWNQVSDMASGIALANINASKISQIEIPLPSLEDQKKICQNLKILITKTNHIEKSIEKSISTIDALQQAVLAKAFRGELVAQDPNEEPASALLARMEASRGDTVLGRGRRRGGASGGVRGREAGGAGRAEGLGGGQEEASGSGGGFARSAEGFGGWSQMGLFGGEAGGSRLDAVVWGAARRGASAEPLERGGGQEEDGRGRVLRCLREAGEGLGKAALLEGAGLSEGEWLGVIRGLVSEGAVVQEGQKRGTRYRLARSE